MRSPEQSPLGWLGLAASRTLLGLLELSIAERRPERLLGAAADGWGHGRLASAAKALARASEDGRAPSDVLAHALPQASLAALAAGEARGDLAGGLARARAVLSRIAARRQLLWQPALHPLAVVSLAFASAAILCAFAVPAFQDLRLQVALISGAPEPGGLLAWAAAHSRFAVGLGLVLSLAPLVLPAVAALAARGRAGALLLRLPILGPALQAGAAADFGESFGGLLAAGSRLDEAWDRAAGSVSFFVLRRRLQAESVAVTAGDPVPELLVRAGLSPEAAACFAPDRVRGDRDGGAAAARRLADEASAEHLRLLAVAGRALATGAWIFGAVLAFALAHAVLSPLLGAGAI